MMSPQGTIPATGKKINMRFAEYYQVLHGGQIATQRGYFANAEMMQQLGIAPGS